MDYAMLGKTGFRVSRLGFGSSGMGNIYTSVEQDEINRNVAEAVDEYGINYFDVAPSYGPEGLAETRLGIGLEGRRSRVILATKAGRYDHGTEDRSAFEVDFSAKRTRLELENSLRRLRTDYVDLYQLHDITNSGDLDLLVEETLPELEKMKREGKIRAIGLTGAHLGAMEYVASRSSCVDAVLTFGRYNLMDVTLEDYAPKFRALGNIGIINSSLMFMGHLTMDHREVKDWRNHRDENSPFIIAVEEAKEFCRQRGADLGEAAVRFGLCCEHCADTTLIAMARLERMRQNVALYYDRNNQDPELRDGLRRILGGRFPWKVPAVSELVKKH